MKTANNNNIEIIPLISYKKIGIKYGFLMKLLLANKYIKYLPDEQIILFVDGYDVLILNTKDNIIKKYYELTKGNKALFASEVAYWPDENLSSEYPEFLTKYKYLNSGCYISTVKILKIINEINSDIEVDDQGVFTKIFLYNCRDLIIIQKYFVVYMIV